MGRGEGKGGKRREEEGRGGEALGSAPIHNFWLRHWYCAMMVLALVGAAAPSDE